MRKTWWILVLCIVLPTAACKKKAENEPAAQEPAGPAAPAEPAAAPTPTPEEAPEPAAEETPTPEEPETPPEEVATPEETGPALPFQEWTLTAAETAWEDGASVWAAAVNAEGKWTLGGMRFTGKDGDVLHLSKLGEFWAPSAFARVCPPVEEFEAGALVMMRHGTGTNYGKVTRVEGDKVFVNYLPSPAITEGEMGQGGVVPLVAGEWALGAPAAIRDDIGWLPVTVVHLEGDTVYIYDGTVVRPMPQAEVHLIDFATERRVGQRVLALQYSGFSPLRIVPAKITEVLGDGAGFAVETDEGKRWKQSFAWVWTPPEE